MPADIITYLEAHGRQRVGVRADPGDALDFPDSQRILQTHLHQSPLFRSYSRGAGKAVKVSDFLTRRQFERLALYQEFFRRMGSPYTMAKGLPGPSGAVTAVTLHRSVRDFSEGDKFMLSMLGPHLNHAFGTAARLGGMVDEIAGLRAQTPDRLELSDRVEERHGFAGAIRSLGVWGPCRGPPCSQSARARRVYPIRAVASSGLSASAAA